MIFGINCGISSIKGEFGAGISAEWIASAEPSSTRSVRRVKTERIAKTIRQKVIMRKKRVGRRMVGVVFQSGGILER